MAKKHKSTKSEEEKMIEDIRDRLSEGEELRDVASYYGLSCRAVCRLVAEVPKEDLSGYDSLEDGYVDPDFE